MSGVLLGCQKSKFIQKNSVDLFIYSIWKITHICPSSLHSFIQSFSRTFTLFIFFFCWCNLLFKFASAVRYQWLFHSKRVHLRDTYFICFFLVHSINISHFTLIFRLLVAFLHSLFPIVPSVFFPPFRASFVYYSTR